MILDKFVDMAVFFGFSFKTLMLLAQTNHQLELHINVVIPEYQPPLILGAIQFFNSDLPLTYNFIT